MGFKKWNPVVTKRARSSGALSVVAASGVSRVSHVVRIPSGACPVSGNPVLGWLRMDYAPADVTVEVVSLLWAVEWACSGAPGAPSSVEALAAWAAGAGRAATGVETVVTATVIVRPGWQVLTCEARA